MFVPLDLLFPLALLFGLAFMMFGSSNVIEFSRLTKFFLFVVGLGLLGFALSMPRIFI